MRETCTSILFWACALLVLALSALAALTGPELGWTPGGMALALLAAPVGAAALSGRRGTAFAVALLATGGCLLEAALSGAPAGGAVGLTFPSLAGCGLLVLAGVVCAASERFRLTIERLAAQNADYVRELYERSRRETEAAKVPAATPSESVHADHVDYAMLLLTIQDIGRRIATNLDLETLIPTIISSAQASLRCGRCQVFLWNPRTDVLAPALPPRPRDGDRFLPRAGTGVGRWVLQRRQILTRRAVEEDYELRPLLEEDPHLPDAMAPLCVGGEVLGVLVVEDVEQDSSNFVRLLYALANIYALGIKNAQLFRRIEDMARRDGLTGLLNHATFMQEFGELAKDAERRSVPLAVVMCDVDHFKQFNDRHGHRAGDHVLRETARLWKLLAPESALVARYGGEEFIWALPSTGLESARELAEMLRETLAAHPLDFEGKQLAVTASFGVTERGPQPCEPEQLLRLADEGLYMAKAAGRNCVVCRTAGTAVGAEERTAGEAINSGAAIPSPPGFAGGEGWGEGGERRRSGLPA